MLIPWYLNGFSGLNTDPVFAFPLHPRHIPSKRKFRISFTNFKMRVYNLCRCHIGVSPQIIGTAFALRFPRESRLTPHPTPPHIHACYKKKKFWRSQNIFIVHCWQTYMYPQKWRLHSLVVSEKFQMRLEWRFFFSENPPPPMAFSFEFPTKILF